jgi:hypothetical protein
MELLWPVARQGCASALQLALEVQRDAGPAEIVQRLTAGDATATIEFRPLSKR